MDVGNLCYICKEKFGVATCNGCNKSFCHKHFADHRVWIEAEFGQLINTCRNFKNKVDVHKETNDLRDALYYKINQWESMIIQKVKESADLAREQVTKIIQDHIDAINEELKQLSDKLQVADNQQNFVEKDLSELKKILEELEKKYKQITQAESVNLYTNEAEQIEWQSLIYVEDELKCPWVCRKNLKSPKM